MKQKRYISIGLLILFAFVNQLAMASDISGEWQSEWGTMILKTAQKDSQGKCSITGFWGPQEQKLGTIDSGTFDPVSNMLEFSYHDASGHGGTARLLLLPGETKFTGPWTEGMNSGNWTLVRIPMIKTESIRGTWQSTFGPVTIQEKNSKGKITSVFGFWGINATAGDIKDGTYDAATGVLEFNYFDKTTNAPGKAIMVLSRDQRTLSGIYSERGSEGIWTMTRQ